MRSVIVACMLIMFGASAADAACGTRGGPGYRLKGKCVSWAELAGSCGCKSTTTCNREDADPEADKRLEAECTRGNAPRSKFRTGGTF